MSILAAYLIALLSIVAPGFALAYALLGKTKLHLFEIAVIGIIFGLIFPPTLTWLESYLMDYIHAFTFSAGLFEANAFVLTLAGIVLIWYQGMLKLPNKRREEAARERERLSSIKEIRQKVSELGLDMTLIREHEREESELASRHSREMEELATAGPEEREHIKEMHDSEERKLLEEHEREERMLLDGGAEKKKAVHSQAAMWTALSILMLLAFGTRIANISKAPTFFEFDPYFDMISTQYILTYGYQLLHDTAAWPVVATGVVHRIQPIVPYLEAFWYELASPGGSGNISTSLLSYVSSFYPPIVAALLVFVVFMFLYHEYGAKPALFGASLTATMPVLITTFIAGEQLLEPWGIFTLFFFYVAYTLAVKDQKSVRLAVLAGIAFASTFLGAHYYTVDAGVLALYILVQGIIDLVREGKIERDFYKMNAIVLFVIALFLAAYHPYHATLSGRIPNLLGIPITLSFGLYALIAIAVMDLLVRKLSGKFEKNMLAAYAISAISLVGLVGMVFAYVSGGLNKFRKQFARYSIVALVALILVSGVLLTPLGNPLKSYFQLSKHFTSPSSPLFMTVQEFEPTGFGYDFASAGFGLIGINLFVWLVLVLFVLASIAAIYYRRSKTSVMMLAAILPLAFAAMIEVKYLPHFGVAYILAMSIVIGEMLLTFGKKYAWLDRAASIGMAIIVLVVAVPALVGVFGGLANASNCTKIASNGNAVGFDMFCNQVPGAWLNATAWMRANVGPYGPRILSWWDYGDWINWFGNSNAVLRGDNAVPALDYATAARYVLGQKDGFGPGNLANFSDSVQAKYVLFDNALTQKWGALDFLACIYTNQTSMAFAKAAANGTGQPYVLGTSQCELSHDPAIILLPINTSSISSYCAPIKSLKNETMLRGIVLVGDTLTNTTYCAPLTRTAGAERLYYPNGTETNALLVPSQQFYQGNTQIGGVGFMAFMLLYLPNANGTIAAPSLFYNSNYYRGFYLGSLPGFTLVYPKNFTGINYVNGTHPVMIYELDNFTGTLPTVTPKPYWVHNNYTIPG
ncbi:MAG: hypothetical protein ACP5T3_03280 [Candidatus Micrarchaeia archaeon]